LTESRGTFCKPPRSQTQASEASATATVSDSAAGVPAAPVMSAAMPAANGAAKISTIGLISTARIADVHLAQIANSCMPSRRN
jgi:hypothetical protein